MFSSGDLGENHFGVTPWSKSQSSSSGCFVIICRSEPELCAICYLYVVDVPDLLLGGCRLMYELCQLCMTPHPFVESCCMIMGGCGCAGGVNSGWWSCSSCCIYSAWWSTVLYTCDYSTVCFLAWLLSLFFTNTRNVHPIRAYTLGLRATINTKTSNARFIAHHAYWTFSCLKPQHPQLAHVPMEHFHFLMSRTEVDYV